MSRKQILVVDDHPLFAAAVSDILRELDPDAGVHTVASLAAARVFLSDRGMPALVFLDLNLPDSPASQSLREYSTLFEGAQVVVFSGMDDDLRVRQALAGGAIGFISKALRPAEIMRALTKLLAGESMSPLTPQGNNATGDSKLSPRQREVMDAIAAGLSNKEIARDLGMAAGTVKVHVREIFSRLGAHNRVEAIALYQRSA